MLNLYGPVFYEAYLLENVQNRATKLVNGISKVDYTKRLKIYLPSLAYRRLRGDMIETYKHNYDKRVLSSSFQPPQASLNDYIIV